MAGPRGIEEGGVIAGRYVVERLLGKGGMGAVYAARNRNSGRQVALKIIKAELDESPEQRRRFLREAKAATAIRHAHVIEVLDVFEDGDGTLVMVMELLEGETLKDYRKRVGAVTLHEAARILLPVAEALEAAHEKGIVHRDLKPENIFLADKNGETCPTVLDFGIAKVLDPKALSGETHGQETATGSLLGTPHYMSYEQAMSDKDIDQRADVWAVGVILFELMTGRRPIEFENLGEMYTAFITGTIPSIRDCVVDLPGDAAAIIDRCLVKERAQRLDDLEPLVAILRRYAVPEAPGGGAGGRVLRDLQRPSSVPAASSSTSSASIEGVARNATRTPRWSWAAAALAVAVGGGATALYVAGTSSESPLGEEQAPMGANELSEVEPVGSAVGPIRPSLEEAAHDGGLDGEDDATQAKDEGSETNTSAVPPVTPNPARPGKGHSTTPKAETPEPPPLPAPEPRRPGLADVNPYASSE